MHNVIQQKDRWWIKDGDTLFSGSGGIQTVLAIAKLYGIVLYFDNKK